MADIIIDMSEVADLQNVAQGYTVTRADLVRQREQAENALKAAIPDSVRHHHLSHDEPAARVTVETLGKAASLTDAAGTALALSDPRARAAASLAAQAAVWDAMDPQFALSVMKVAGPDQLAAQLRGNLAQLQESIGKDITLTTPISTGLSPYDLDIPAKQLYPVYSPLRNKIPRTKGMGQAKHFKRITAITGSSGTVSAPWFINELPGGNFGSLNYPPAISLTGDDQSVNYVAMGIGNNASIFAELAGRGFQDIDALLNKTLLQSAFLNEELAMLFAHVAALTTPTGLAVTPQAPTGSNTNISGMTTHIYVKVTALSGFGETVGSGAVTATPSSQDVLVSWTAVPGAVGYNVYVSTGGSDPGDASRFFWGTTTQTSIELGGALPTTTATCPTVGTTAQSNGYNGMLQAIAANGYFKQLNAGFATGGTELQNMFASMWATNKANPDELWAAGTDRRQVSQQIIAGNSGSSAYRIAFQSDDQGHISGGQVVTAVWNETTGKEVDLTVHPWLPQGTLLCLSYQLPFPNSETPNVWENVMVQDYLGLAFPQFDLARRYALVCYGALVPYAPAWNGMISGITNA